MKKKSLTLRRPYFFGQRIQSSGSSGHMFELITLGAEWERAESGTEDLLRWEDDGGKALGLEYQTARLSPDAARNSKR